MVVLNLWDKLAIVGCGLAVVAVALILVICIVAPFCPLHRILPERARLPLSPVKKRKKRWLLTGSSSLNNVNGETLKLKSGSTYISYGQEIRNGGSSPNENGNTGKSATDGWSNDVVSAKNINQAQTIIQPKRPSVLTTRESTVDSTYSSMTPTGSRPSTPISSKRSSQSDLMLPETLSNIGDASSVRSVDTSPLYGSITISIQLSPTQNDNTSRLLIVVKEAQDLPSRDMIACGDPFFVITIVKDVNKTFRKRNKSKGDLIAEFVTNVQRKTRHPIYNQEFQIEINKTDIKDCEIRISGFDKDKYANPTEVGVAVIHLKNLKLPISGNPITLSFELTEPKRINGEIQLGLMYLPTAERMAFSNFKLTNVHTGQTANTEPYKVFIRVVALYNGKMVGKKKTEACKYSPTTALSFDDSLAFDLPTDQLRNMSFVVVVVALDNETSNEAKSRKNLSNQNINDKESPTTVFEVTTKERCVGKVTLGPNSRSTGLQHWEIALHRPREQIILWHVLR
ncbi:Synaptotagmin-12 [Chamberlinius hualienensis]